MNKYLIKILIFKTLLISVICFQESYAQNPIIGNIGISDPHIRVFNDSIFLFSGHDSNPDDKTWVMKDWRVFSTTDLVNWSLNTTISPKDNYMDDNSSDCWASDSASRNGKYYFYFSDRKRGIGVMGSDSPSGKYKDLLGKPLVSPMHDPTILIDDNKEKTPYIVYGDKEGGGYFIAKLNNDMISLSESPKPIIINGEEWVNAPIWMDKNYIFKYKNTYYLSWGKNYAISNNAYGPYNYKGSVGNGYNLGEFAHGSFFWWKGQFYHIWCYYLRPGFKYRESIITYCHFNDEGEIVTDTKFLDSHFKNGVGQYNASWDKIESEWYYEISGEIQKKGNKEKGFLLSNISDGDWIGYANVTFNQVYNKFTAKTNFKGQNGFLEIRMDNEFGELVGKIKLTSSTNNNLQEVSCSIDEFIGKRDVFLVFKGEKESTMQIDWFKFEKQ